MSLLLLISAAFLTRPAAANGVCDSDICLQNSPDWGSGYTCAGSSWYCESWAKDMYRCCPETCNTGLLSESECNAMGSSGTCTYPNEAQACSAPVNCVLDEIDRKECSYCGQVLTQRITREAHNGGTCSPITYTCGQGDRGCVTTDPSPLQECRNSCEQNTCEKDAHNTFSSHEMLSCANACYMREIGVTKDECLRSCDRSGGSGCSLTFQGVNFELCHSNIRGETCEGLHVFVSDCVTGCTSYPDPTYNPTMDPTVEPSEAPSKAPTPSPTTQPTVDPTRAPSKKPSRAPTPSPTTQPTVDPTRAPSKKPSRAPTPSPTTQPTVDPTRAPSGKPSRAPTPSPTTQPTVDPTRAPSKKPSRAPTPSPTTQPTVDPTRAPSKRPSRAPTPSPTTQPTVDPTRAPSKKPSRAPTPSPTTQPTVDPTKAPSNGPTTDSPSKTPSLSPTVSPTTSSPSTAPTAGDFIVKVQGFAGRPEDFIDREAARDQHRMNAYQFDFVRQLKKAKTTPPLEECRNSCEKNTCEQDAHNTFSSHEMLSCANACYMRELGVTKDECLRSCDRGGGSGCSLTFQGVNFELCHSNIRGETCEGFHVYVADCVVGCTSYPDDGSSRKL